MYSPRTPLHARHVAFTFAGVFIAIAALLTLWYEPAILLQDPLLRFSWAGTAYVFAYCVTETVRLPGYRTILYLPAALLLLACDIARHGGVIQQLYYQPWLSGLPFVELSVGACVAGGGRAWTCKAVLPLVEHAVIVWSMVAALLLVSMVLKLSHRDGTAQAGRATPHA